MGARHARIEEILLDEAQEKAQPSEGGKLPPLGLSSPDEYRAAIHVALDNESLRRAQRAAAEGHAKFPDDPELAKLNRLLTFRPARSVPGPLSPDRTEAFRWLDEHGKAYHGQWIALGDKGLLAASPDLDDVLRTLQEISPDVLPVLLHLV